MESNSYPYSPLSGDEIRYLTVHAFDESIGVVQCTLQHASLRSLQGSFTALSYVWGDRNVTESIQLMGRPFNVTVNLASSLRQFATNPRQQQGCLWVDAICINQCDLDERNVQVQRMKDIYSSAASVIAWLGPSTHLSDIGMHHLQSINENEVQGVFSLGHIDWNQFERVWNEIILGDGEAGLRELVRNPYWKRTWIIQELVLNRRVRLACGGKEVKLGKLQALVKLTIPLLEHRSYVKKDLSSAVNQLTVDIVLNGPNDIYYFIGLQQPRFLQTIHRAKYFNCSDARDKVYALLGICSHSEARRIVPDYNCPIAKVYGDVAEAHIHTHDNLSILNYAGYQSNEDTSCASWIPDWRATGPKQVAGDFQGGERYDASNKLRLSSHDWSLNRITEKLHLTGACLDTITTLGNARSQQWVAFAGEELIVDAAKSCMQLCFRTLAQGNLDAESTAPRSFQVHDAPTYPLNDNEPLEHACKRTLVTDYDSQGVAISPGSPGSPFMMLLPGDEPQQRSDGSVYTHHDTFDSCAVALTGSRMAFTSKGWMGLVPAETEVGDYVALLIGADTPFILRRAPTDGSSLELDEKGLGETTKAEEEFLVIGGAYVHGLMHGRGLKLAELGRITLR